MNPNGASQAGTGLIEGFNARSVHTVSIFSKALIIIVLCFKRYYGWMQFCAAGVKDGREQRMKR